MSRTFLPVWIFEAKATRPGTRLAYDIDMGFDILNLDYGNWTIGPYMADSGVGDDGVDV